MERFTNTELTRSPARQTNEYATHNCKRPETGSCLCHVLAKADFMFVHDGLVELR